jgi:hypothetical protein
MLCGNYEIWCRDPLHQPEAARVTRMGVIFFMDWLRWAISYELGGPCPRSVEDSRSEARRSSGTGSGAGPAAYDELPAYAFLKVLTKKRLMLDGFIESCTTF